MWFTVCCLTTLLIADVTNMNEWVWSVGGMVLTGTTRSHIELLSQCHFVHHISRMYWTKTEPGPSLWQAGDLPPEPFTVRTRTHKIICRVIQKLLLFLIFIEIWNVLSKFSKAFQRQLSETYVRTFRACCDERQTEELWTVQTHCDKLYKWISQRIGPIYFRIFYVSVIRFKTVKV